MSPSVTLQVSDECVCKSITVGFRLSYSRFVLTCLQNAESLPSLTVLINLTGINTEDLQCVCVCV